MEDKLELLPSGKIRAVADGTEYNLRLPKLGEFKELRLWLEDFQEETSKANMHNLEHALDKDHVKMAVPDQQEGTRTWVAMAFEKLSDRPLPEDVDDWPIWLAYGDGIIAEMIKHWREVPLVRGSR